MKDYQHFNVEDFIADDYFIDWVLQPNALHDRFWNAFMLANPAKKGTIEQAKRIVLSIRIDALPEQLNLDDMLQMKARLENIGHNKGEEKPVKNIYKATVFAKVAAMFLLISIAGYLIYSNTKPANSIIGQSVLGENLTRVINNTKESKVIFFADGSLAILKPSSTLTYPRKFNADKRVVKLQGEAFFEVRKDKAHPFFVYADDMVTRVVGTSFTVSAYGNRKAFNVVVTTGKVMVYNAKSPQKYLVKLAPHQKAIFVKNNTEILRDTVITPLKLAGDVAVKSFTFDRTPLPIVVRELEEAYQVRIIYDENQFDKLTVTASLALLPLDEKIKLIAKAVNADCTFNNGQITLKKTN